MIWIPKILLLIVAVILIIYSWMVIVTGDEDNKAGRFRSTDLWACAINFFGAWAAAIFAAWLAAVI